MLTWSTLAFCAATAPKPQIKPHILFVLIDDFGHAEMGYHRDPPTREVQTPNMDELALNGVKLERHYVHKFCSPTRCAIQSGRAPVHVNVINASPDVSNPADPVAGFAAIPRNMTGIAHVMREAGYQTHIAGKWDAGMATPDHTPAGRGYDTSLIYFHHANDYWTFAVSGCKNVPDTAYAAKNVTGPTDLWNCFYGKCDAQFGVPAVGQGAHNKVNGAGCTQGHQTATDPSQPCTYEDALFEQRITNVINNHTNTAEEKPLFLFWSTHIVHGPLQVPQAELNNFTSFIPDKTRATYHAMVHWIDGAIGRVTLLMKEKGLWENTLMVLSADNGGKLSSSLSHSLSLYTLSFALSLSCVRSPSLAPSLPLSFFSLSPLYRAYRWWVKQLSAARRQVFELGGRHSRQRIRFGWLSPTNCSRNGPIRIDCRMGLVRNLCRVGRCRPDGPQGRSGRTSSDRQHRRLAPRKQRNEWNVASHTARDRKQRGG